MGRKIVTTVVVLLGAALVGIVLFVSSGPALPAGTDALVDEVLSSDLPELVTGTTGVARSGSINIWYESIGFREGSRGTVLLVSGAGQSSLRWPSALIEPLADAGYHVVRFDNRGVGRSDWMATWSSADPYTVEDMALDGIAVLDALDVPRAHVVGLSMGGMIGQRMAISHADRVLSLTSISSAGHPADPELPSVAWGFVRDLLRLGLRYGIVESDENLIRRVLGLELLLQGDAGVPRESERRASAETTLYVLRRHKGLNTAATTQHTAAVDTSGSRYDELGTISVPTLVVHGRSDPLIPLAHAERYAALIPSARTLWIDRMGHLFYEVHLPLIVDAMFDLFAETERR